MSAQNGFDRELAVYLMARSTTTAPDGLLERAMGRIETTHQRPAWVMLDRWLPSRITDEVATIRRIAVLVAVVVLLVALALAMGMVIGSRPRLPPPFGPARPGLLTFDGGGHIFVANPDGSGRVQLTFGQGRDFGAAWSPDGTRIAYASEGVDLATSVLVMDADGRHATTLGGGLADVGSIRWSPDSQHVIMAGRPLGGRARGDDWRILVGEVATPGLRPLGDPDLFGQDPSWSPDGGAIAFTRVYPCCSGPDATLWLMDADGSHVHQLPGTSGAWAAAWSPDGSRIAYLATAKAGAEDVFVINADGSGGRDISNSPEEESGLAWSPDGKRIAFARDWDQYGGAASFVVAEPDGSNATVLPGPYVAAGMPVWSPDGNLVIGFPLNLPVHVSVDVHAVDSVVAFDPSGRSRPVTLPIASPLDGSVRLSLAHASGDFPAAAWQRLAP
jgi:Tol biopolymer transport system component